MARWRYGLLVLCTLLLALFGQAQARRARPERLNVQLEPKNSKKSPDSNINYLVTLSRTATNAVKDDLLGVLMEKGAVVTQVYDYRVYKGVLFSVSQSADRGLKAWQSALGKIKGVKAVEEDQIVNASDD